MNIYEIYTHTQDFLRMFKKLEDKAWVVGEQFVALS